MAGGGKNSSCGFRLIGPGGDSFTAYNLTHTPHLLDIIELKSKSKDILSHDFKPPI